MSKNEMVSVSREHQNKLLNCHSTIRKQSELIDTLLAQLGERDALLRQASEVGGLTEDWHEKVSALSASAEPCPDCKSSAPVKLDERAEFEKHFGNCTWGEDDYANEQRGWEARAALERKP